MKVLEVKAPNKCVDHTTSHPFTLFLAGSIEMGAAENWQEKFVALITERMKDVLEGWELVIYNPRRDDFDVSQEQSASNPYFAEQVNWELDNLYQSELHIFWFADDTLSPITLYEFGKHTNDGSFRMEPLVGCGPRYKRRGNLEIIAQREYIHLYSTIEEMVEATAKLMEDFVC